MTRKIAYLAFIVVFAAASGCAVERHYVYDPGRTAVVGTMVGAPTGAALGAIIGAAVGDPATGAWAGAATGAVAGLVGGFLYAEHLNRVSRTGPVAAQAHAYSPAQGSLVTIDRVDVVPTRVRPGEQTRVAISYTILTPENATLPVTVVREIRRNDIALAPAYQVRYLNNNGSYIDEVPLSIPRDALPGEYTVSTRVITERGSAERNVPLTIG
jgi:hypothetical protein